MYGGILYLNYKNQKYHLEHVQISSLSLDHGNLNMLLVGYLFFRVREQGVFSPNNGSPARRTG